MLKIARTFTLISLFALSLSAMLETQAQAALSIKQCGTGTAVCAVTTGVSPNQIVTYYVARDTNTADGVTVCHRSGAAPNGGSFSGAASTCDDLLNGVFRCPNASLDLERNEFYAAAPDTSEMDMLTTDPTFTFAATPSPGQVATFVSMAASEPIILAAQPQAPLITPVAYLVSSGGAGAGNLDLNPAVAIGTFRPTAAGVNCMNNGGGIGGFGKPFFPTAILTQRDIFDATNLQGRGQWGSDIPFTIEQLQAAITIPDDACKQNWQVIPNSLTVLSAIIDVVVNSCTDDNCLGILIPNDRWAKSCTYNSDGTDTCSTIFHCKDINDAAQREACLGQSLP